MSMYNAEVAGPTRERVLPRLHDMTNVLFRMYSGFTLIALVIFLLCGMDFINALNHALSTISAGGFSTFNASVAHFDDPVVEGWITFFMILAGGNFGLYYQVYQKGPGVLRRNTEFKAYLLILGVVTLLIMLNLAYAFGGEWTTAFRYASFQVASIATTGFVSADYDTWPAFFPSCCCFSHDLRRLCRFDGGGPQGIPRRHLGQGPVDYGLSKRFIPTWCAA